MAAEPFPPRIGPPVTAGERETLRAFLDYQRATLAMKCHGLSDDELRRQSSPPSTLSLLGLVRHMAEVERSWFLRVLGGEDAPFRYFTEENRDGEFDDVANADVAEAFASWHADCARARELVAAAPSLDVTGERRGERFSLRWIITHMIEEYARHNGHADLLRERIDGAVGD